MPWAEAEGRRPTVEQDKVRTPARRERQELQAQVLREVPAQVPREWAEWRRERAEWQVAARVE